MKTKGMAMEESEQLRIGDIIEVNTEVPIMPRLRLKQIRRGDVIHRVKAHHRFRIIGKGKNGRKWYKVATTIRGVRVVGWINSVCLVGKRVYVVAVLDYSNQDKLEESRQEESVCAVIYAIVAIIGFAIGVCLRILWKM